MKALLPFLKLFKQQLWWLILGIALSYITILASLGLMSLSGWFISAAAYASLSYAAASQFNFFLPAAGVRFFSLTRILGRYGERLATHEATFKILTDIRVWFYRKLAPLAPAHLMKYKSGDLLSRVVNDIDALDNLYIRVIAPTLVVIFAALSLIGLFSFFDFRIALFAGVMVLLTAFFIPLITGWMARHTSSQVTQQTSTLKSSTVDYIQGLSELKLFAQDQKFLNQMAKEDQALVRTQQKMASYKGLGAALMSLCLGITLVGVVWMAVVAVHAKDFSGALIALLALGVLAVFESVNPLPVAYQYLGKTVSAAKRLLHVVEAEPEVVFKDKEPVSFNSYDIQFENVSFGYAEGNPIFQNYCTEIKQGERVAIVGQTGSGKSTLLHLLSRFWDVSAGAISIGGIDLREFSEPQLRQLITIITQKPHIFNTTIRQNLKLAKEEATSEEMWYALEVVGLKSFVEKLPKGLDTWTGEHGRTLSGGQQKRLSLACAVLRDAPILILDEPTEGLDSITEQKVMQALQNVMINKTVLMVTHNPQLMAQMERSICF